METITSFGEWLRRARKACDLTQAELAQQVGCAEGTIRNLEADTLRPSKQLAARLAAQLGLAPDAQAAVIVFARGGAIPPPLLPALPALPLPPSTLHDRPGRSFRPAERSRSCSPTSKAARPGGSSIRRPCTARWCATMPS